MVRLETKHVVIIRSILTPSFKSFLSASLLANPGRGSRFVSNRADQKPLTREDVLTLKLFVCLAIFKYAHQVLNYTNPI